MAQFDDREKAHEAKFARDGELRFKAEARRNKLLGLWAAEHMGLSAEHAKEYAAEVVASTMHMTVGPQQWNIARALADAGLLAALAPSGRDIDRAERAEARADAAEATVARVRELRRDLASAPTIVTVSRESVVRRLDAALADPQSGRDAAAEGGEQPTP